MTFFHTGALYKMRGSILPVENEFSAAWFNPQLIFAILNGQISIVCIFSHVVYVFSKFSITRLCILNCYFSVQFLFYILSVSLVVFNLKSFEITWSKFLWNTLCCHFIMYLVPSKMYIFALLLATLTLNVIRLWYEQL